MICTSSYNDCKSNKYITYSISGNRGRDANYQGKCYPDLAPKSSFWKIWHHNIGKISEEENNRYYVNEYWKQVLSKLDPKEVYKQLDNSILLCYESNIKFCHRHLVSAWLEILLDKDIPEIKIEDDKLKEIGRPQYIKQYLEDAMRQNINMRGFKSFKALYLFEQKGKLGIKTSPSNDTDMDEDEYNKI